MADITIQSLQFSRGDFVPDLKIKYGEKIALMGENGCGKSTLIDLATGLIEVPKGAVFYNDQAIDTISHSARARLFSVLAQFSDISFPFSVMEVALLGRYVHLTTNEFQQEDRDKTLKLLKLLDIEQYKNKRYSDLSGGEKRRVMIARVLNQEAPIIFMDEPSSSLDIRHTLEIFEHMSQRPQTVITSVHDINLAYQYFDRFLFFKRGNLIYDVAKSDITPQLLSEVYDVSVSTDTHSFSFCPN